MILLLAMSKAKGIHGQVVETIASWITGKRYQVGETLPVEAALCHELGVSRTVVREAIKTLSAKGLVQAGPRVGTRVLPYSNWHLFDPRVIDWRLEAGVDQTFIDDLIELRLAIEPAAAGIAARRATAADKAQLIEDFRSMQAAAPHPGAYLKADLAFHRGILLATENQFFLSLSPLIQSVLNVSFRLSVHEPEEIIQSLPLHEAVVTSILAGESEAATNAMRRIITSARGDIDRHLPVRTEEGR
jgi:GntR family transcriptional regulator, galactonate operon transcriptional repressor